MTNPGYVYVAALAVLGTLGWVGAFLATLYAFITERRDIAVLVPALWFAALVLSALVAAVVIGPAPCPS